MKKIWIIAKKELSTYFYNPLGYFAAGIMIVLANWLFFKDIFLINQASMTSYWSTATFLLSLFIPAMTMGLFADEKKNNTWEILSSLPIKIKDIVWGKFIGGGLFVLFTLFLSLPVLITLLIIGKPMIGLLIGGYLGASLLCLSFLSLGLFISAIFDQALMAYLVSSVVLILNSFLAQFKYFTDFSLAYRSAKFANGLIDIGDLFFFISWILIFTILSILVKSRKKLNMVLINFLLCIVAVNVLLYFYPSLKIDISKDKIHSLSPETKNIIRKLDDVVNIKVILSSNLPNETKPAVDKLKAILDEFKRVNKNKLIVSYADPNKDKEANNLVTSLGIGSIQFNSIKKDKLEIQNGYMAVVVNYGQKNQVLNLDLQNMEYLLISGIKRILVDKVNSVGVYSEDDLKYFKQYLAKDYTVYDIDIFSKDKLPDVDTLVIHGLTKKMDEKTIQKINDWIKSKKGLIVYLDRIFVDDDLKSTLIEKTGMEKILADVGMEIEDKLVIDASSGIANFNTGNGLVTTQYQFWPLIRTENINNKLPVMSGIDSLQLAWASPIKINDKIKTLFTSTAVSQINDNIKDLSPMIKVGEGEKQISVLGAINTEDGNRIALIADADMIKDNFVASNDRNLYFALNLVDYFSSDDDLLKIRSKALRVPVLNEYSEETKLMIKIINIAAPIILLVIIGVFCNKRRKYLNGMNYEE
jgi:ABC-type transport system involved in multi-copper enzyme maturation permease subunit